MYNSILRNEKFPNSCKVRKVVLIKNPGKKGSDVSDYGPICLLNIPAKR